MQSPIDPTSVANLMFSGGELKPGNASAAIIMQGSRYLVQKRSAIPRIFYPAHWGLFGGALEDGEGFAEGLRREVFEELAIELDELSYFTEFTFDLSDIGYGEILRQYFVARVSQEQLDRIDQKEGDGMALFEARELLVMPYLVPYDAFAIWLHASYRT